MLISLACAYLVALVYLICRKKKRSTRNRESDNNYQQFGATDVTQEQSEFSYSYYDETSASGSSYSMNQSERGLTKNTMSNSSVAHYGDDMKRKLTNSIKPVRPPLSTKRQLYKRYASKNFLFSQSPTIQNEVESQKAELYLNLGSP